jgi:glycosyltransferase involved in cell wall biosynthesis
LLLQEDQAAGGVATMTSTLCAALQQQGWPVRLLALDQTGWLALLAAARQSNVILASNNFRPAYAAWVLGLLLRKPVVVWVHGPLHEVLDQASASGVKRAWLHWLYRRLPQFVFVSRASCDSFKRFMGHKLKPGQRLTVVFNAVTMQPNRQDTHLKTASAEVKIQLAYIGRLSQEKHPCLLLDMLRLLPSQYQLTLVGDGPLRDVLRQQGADLLASGRLSLLGQQAHGPGLYAPWALTLLASRYEGCPMTLLESLAMGVPCVGLPIPAIKEVVGNTAPCLLANDNTAQALADAVQSVQQLPREQLQADMARVLERYRVQDFVRRWQNELQLAARAC